MRISKFLYIAILLVVIILFWVKDKSPAQQKEFPRTIETVIIDAGHGGKDPGTIGTTGIYEKDINLAIALKLRSLLQQKYEDMKIVLTRDDDRFIELHERGRIANSSGGSLFVSIHANAKRTEEMPKSGFELYILNIEKVNDAAGITGNENIFLGAKNTDSVNSGFILSNIAQNSFLKYSERIAKIIQVEMVKGTKLNSRGVFQEPFVVLYGASMPTILVECGYLSDKNDEAYLNSDSGQNEVANSIYKAVRYYKFDYDYENK